jgi:NADH-quinone oxidoreductase subunit M
LGFVLLGAFARNRLGMQGAVMQMICHGLSTGGLFLIAGMLQDRLHTRDMGKMGGLWASMPRMGACAMFLAMASLGLPGLGNFVAEFLVLLGAYQASPVIAVIATAGLVPATLYSLWMIYRVFHGPVQVRENASDSAPATPVTAEATGVPVEASHATGDLRIGELAILLVLVATLLWLGLFPQAVLDTADQEPSAGARILQIEHTDRIPAAPNEVDSPLPGGSP